MQTTKKIAKLNDLLRTTFMTGRVVMTDGVKALSEEEREKLFTRVREYEAFAPDNDPYGERDFGKIVLEGTGYFWKIDYYDRSLRYGSEKPECARHTTRVLTIMRADEY